MSGEKELFDNAAAMYDTSFTESHIGQFQRARVYHWLDSIAFFDRRKSVFEINCGTGADAAYFHEKGLQVSATDQSAKMVEKAKENRPVGIDFFQLDFTELADQKIESDALFSNFGGLNCISTNELAKVAQTIGSKQSKGDLLIWVIMPRFCLMEGLYFISRFKFGQLFRRNTSKGVAVNVDGTAVATYYHSPRSVKRMLTDEYRIEKVKPVAFFLPPSYLEPFFKRHLGTLRFLNRLEKWVGRVSFFSGWSDHYIIIGEKK